MADDEEIEIEGCECGEPWCDRCAYQRELAVAANPCPACNGSGLATAEDERCRPSAYGESVGSKNHPMTASVATDVLDGSRLLIFEGPGTEIRVSLSVEEARKLGRVLLVVWRPDSEKFSELIGAFNELQREFVGAPGPHVKVSRLFEAIQALREPSEPESS